MRTVWQIEKKEIKRNIRKTKLSLFSFFLVLMKNRLLVNVTRKESMTNIKPDILYYDLIGSLSMY